MLPGLKRVIRIGTLHRALKRSFPRINAGAPAGEFGDRSTDRNEIIEALRKRMQAASKYELDE